MHTHVITLREINKDERDRAVARPFPGKKVFISAPFNHDEETPNGPIGFSRPLRRRTSINQSAKVSGNTLFFVSCRHTGVQLGENRIRGRPA